MTEPTAEQPQVTATVSPAAPQRSRWGAIPRHLGRARTSTVVLSLLFLGIGALWLNVRPAENPPAGTAGVEQPVAPAPPVVPTTSVPTTEPVPTTAPEPTTTSETPTTSSPEIPTSTETSPGFPTTTSETPTPLPGTTSTPTG